MARVPSTVVLLLAALLPATAYAEVFKCTEPDGRKVYKDQPCNADQQAAPFDPDKANVTTIDSEASRREAQEALVTRDAGREAQAADRDEPTGYEEPNYIPVPVYPPEPVYYPYPIYRDDYGRDHHHHHDDRPHIPQRPDATPMSRPSRGGGGYVPTPPTIRDVAPRPPAAPRGRTGASRDDDRRTQIP